jgi:hypothetical protein
MVVINVYPKDLCVVVEHRAANLKKIHKAMQYCTLRIDRKDSEQVEADKAFHQFYQTLDRLLKDLDSDYGA